jgi:SAM-dependent methyltransferase
MAQRNSYFYKIIALPSCYIGLQNLLGAARGRRRFIVEVLRPKRGMNVLDVGCGPASLFPYLSDVAYTDMDLNPKHIAHARAFYGERGRFLVGDVTIDLGRVADSFDLVIVSALLHHLNDVEARRLIAQLAALTKPSGRIVTIDSIWLPRQNPIAWLFNKLDSGLNVRTADEYLRLASGLPLKAEGRVFRDLLRIPYDHFSMTLTRLS